MTSSLIILPIPADIPMPRFRLFQRVACNSEIYQGTGQITGLEWVTKTCAADQETFEPGWSYRVEFDHFKTIEPAPLLFEEDLGLLCQEVA